MKLEFIQIKDIDSKYLNNVYDILKKVGNDMYLKDGLDHWLPPYPLKKIKADLNNHRLFVVKNNLEKKIVATFQLRLKNELIVELNKFAVDSESQHLGIGKEILKYIENYCITENILELKLTVYEESIQAIKFYQKNGFEIVGHQATRRFKVLVMKKLLGER